MKQAVTVRYFDGQISKAHTAQIHPVFYQGQVDGFMVVWRDADNAHQEKRYFAKDCEYLPSVDNSPHAIMLFDGARIEFLSAPPDWIELQHRSLFDNITKMEKAGHGRVVVQVGLWAVPFWHSYGGAPHRSETA